jgi:hypothetical protein
MISSAWIGTHNEEDGGDQVVLGLADTEVPLKTKDAGVGQSGTVQVREEVPVISRAT